jgi:Spy/CpxP family protein refolding chaperone
MNSALKWKLAFAFLLVFVAGMTTGGLLSTLHVRRHFLGPPHSGEVGDRMREHLRRALDLTPEQAAKISPIVDATSAKLEAIRVETAQRVRNAMEESERQISPELTPEQQKKLQTMKSEHQRILMHHGFMPPPPPPPEGPSPAP